MSGDVRFISFDDRIKIEIARLENSREKNNAASAQVGLIKVIEECKNNNRWDLAADALGHLIVCFQHYADDESNSKSKNSLLRTMRELCEQGLSWEVSRQRKAVFHLRLGCYQIRRGNLCVADEEFKVAAKLHETKDGFYYECLGLRAEAAALKKKHSFAFKLLDEAIDFMENDAYAFSMREFHRLTILSGLYFRMLKVSWLAFRPLRFAKALFKSRKYSLKLKQKYGNPRMHNTFVKNTGIKF